MIYCTRCRLWHGNSNAAHVSDRVRDLYPEPAIQFTPYHPSGIPIAGTNCRVVTAYEDPGFEEAPTEQKA